MRYVIPPTPSRLLEPPTNPECPGCGEPSLHVDDVAREAYCQAEGCGWSDAYDWDAEAERRAEAKWDDDHGRDTW